MSSETIKESQSAIVTLTAQKSTVIQEGMIWWTDNVTGFYCVCHPTHENLPQFSETTRILHRIEKNCFIPLAITTEPDGEDRGLGMQSAALLDVLENIGLLEAYHKHYTKSPLAKNKLFTGHIDDPTAPRNLPNDRPRVLAPDETIDPKLLR